MKKFKQWLIQAANVARAFLLMRRMRREYNEVIERALELSRFNDKLSKEIVEVKAERDRLLQQLGQYTVVDPNAKCPACGGNDGKIQAVQSYEEQRAYVQHTCNICGCDWPEEPVYADLGKMWSRPQTPRPIRRVAEISS